MKPVEVGLSNGQGAYFGRNGKQHGGEFYFASNSGEWDSCSVRVPEKDRKKLASFLRRFANRLDPKRGR